MKGKKEAKYIKASKAPKGTKDAKALKVPKASNPRAPYIDEEGVRGLFQLWNDALQTKDSYIVADRYASGGVLLPTLSDRVRADYDGIVDYFDHFLAGGPYGTIIEGYATVGDGYCEDGGIYEFEFDDGSVVRARYSFVYVWEDGEWMISHHHSSLMPEEVVQPEDITVEEVQALFELWNDALQTGDPETVAMRYAPGATLLPTLSDEVRKDPERIADYFIHFLEDEPVGEILDSSVMIGANWAQDAGIYAFTFNDGTVVRARYTFVYVYVDGEWLISQHHSSQMPEDFA